MVRLRTPMRACISELGVDRERLVCMGLGLGLGWDACASAVRAGSARPKLCPVDCTQREFLSIAPLHPAPLQTRATIT